MQAQIPKRQTKPLHYTMAANLLNVTHITLLKLNVEGAECELLEHFLDVTQGDIRTDRSLLVSGWYWYTLKCSASSANAFSTSRKVKLVLIEGSLLELIELGL